jgi:hypothetical protein
MEIRDVLTWAEPHSGQHSETKYLRYISSIIIIYIIDKTALSEPQPSLEDAPHSVRFLLLGFRNNISFTE